MTVTNQYGAIFGATVSMMVIHCPNCGVPFAIPDDLDDRFRANKNSFYCPNGHSMSYNASVTTKRIDELQKEKSALEQRLKGAETSMNFWNQKWEEKNRENKGLKIKAGKLRKRIANGVCPCCHRTFSNLAEHIKNVHPEERKETKDIIV